MTVVSMHFDIDSKVLQEFSEVACGNEQSQVINDLLREYIKKSKIAKLNQTIQAVRKQAKPLENGLTATELIGQLRDNHSWVY